MIHVFSVAFIFSIIPLTLTLQIEYIYLLFQEAGVQEFLSRLCTSALLYPRRIYHNQPQTACRLHGGGNSILRALKVTHMTEYWLVTEAASIKLDRFKFLSETSLTPVSPGIYLCSSSDLNMIRHTCENSWRLSAVFFCHIIADVPSCVTRCKQAFDVEWSKLGKNDTSEQTSIIYGL